MSYFNATPFSENIQVSIIILQPQTLLRFPQDAKNPICCLLSCQNLHFVWQLQ